MTFSRETDAVAALRKAPNDASVRDNLKLLNAPIRSLNGVGPKRAEQLENFGIATIEDLLYHVPFRYEDRREILKLCDAAIGAEGTFVGELSAVRARYIPQRRMQIMNAVLRDDSGAIELVWYRAPSYIVKSLANAHSLIVHGKVEVAPAGQKRIVHPEYEVLASPEHVPAKRIVPIYSRPGGLSLSVITKLISDALRGYGRRMPSCLPPPILKRQGLVKLDDALNLVHEPPLEADVASLNASGSLPHQSIIFDELFYLQLGLALRKRQRLGGHGNSPVNAPRDLTSRMMSLLSFRLTSAQERALREIAGDIKSGHPMQRLLQGDVGCGKTMVAWLASLRVIEHGAQAIWMAPTELLAEQHFRGLKPFADELNLESALLTASTPGQSKRMLLDRIERGEIQFAVGTHALIQQEVRAPRMGLGVVDEQHRFGVLQRFSLQRLTSNGAAQHAHEPHMLLMSATPIPRSLAMVLYGDMDVSFIDEMPPGRTPVKTKIFRATDRRTVYDGVLGELRAGHQVFVVYPLVETSERLDQVRDATQMAEKMRQGAFRDFGVGLLHGRMSSQERDEMMGAFRDGKIGLLVSTTVIEVGIDIPNATLIVVEHAERFGLSQLHQLRGRVGRGSAPGSCFLIDRSSGRGLASERLRVMEKEQSGFKIAEADLALRGPGEFLGTQQSGMPGFRLANLLRDSKLLMEARKEALEWLDKDPDLSSPESGSLRAVLQHRWGRRLQLGAVG